MTAALAWLEARAWQVGASIAVAAAVILAVSLGVTVFQKRGVERDLATVTSKLTATQAALTTCRTNTRTLELSVAEQNTQIDGLRRDTVARIAAAERAVAAANRETAAAQVRINRFMAAPVAGATACERMNDVDARFLEMLR